MKKRFITDGFGIEVEIDDNSKMIKNINISEIDAEIFPPLDIEDKMKMMRLSEAVWARLREILLASAFVKGGVIVAPKTRQSGVPVGEKETEEVKCPNCLGTFPAKKPCHGGCGGRITTELCPLCNQPVRIEWK